jgi:CheY-like chemotaxis protein
MAKILLCEPEAHCRKLLRYILEGIHHEVSETDGCEGLSPLLASDPPDLLILGAPGQPGSRCEDAGWQIGLPELPILLLLSGPPRRRQAFLEAWHGPPGYQVLAQPVEPYPLLAMVKTMLAAPETWRRGGQHKV